MSNSWLLHKANYNHYIFEVNGRRFYRLDQKITYTPYTVITLHPNFKIPFMPRIPLKLHHLVDLASEEFKSHPEVRKIMPDIIRYLLNE